jgi:hypothetical protein
MCKVFSGRDTNILKDLLDDLNKPGYSMSSSHVNQDGSLSTQYAVEVENNYGSKDILWYLILSEKPKLNMFTLSLLRGPGLTK